MRCWGGSLLQGKKMANWVTNELKVTGEVTNLNLFANDIGSPQNPFNFKNLRELFGASWDSRDEGRFPKLVIDKKKKILTYTVDSVHAPLEELFAAISQKYPKLKFELFYIEEGPAFAGLIIYENGEESARAVTDQFEYNNKEELKLNKLKETLRSIALNPISDLIDPVDTDPSTELRKFFDQRFIDFLLPIFVNEMDPKVPIEDTRKLVKNSATSLLSEAFPLIPERCLNEDLAIYLCNVSQSFLKLVPPQYRTIDFYEKFVQQSNSEGNELYYIPEDFLTQGLIDFTLDRTIKSFRYLRKKYQTQELCIKAYQKVFESIKYIDTIFITKEMALDVIEKHTKLVCHLPEKYLSEEAIIKYITVYTGKLPLLILTGNADNDFSSAYVRWVPEKYFTKNLLIAIAIHHPMSLKEVPTEYLSEEILVKAVQGKSVNSNFLFEYGANDKLVLWLPESILTKKLLEETVFHFPHTLENLTEKMKEDIFSDYTFLQKFQENYLLNSSKFTRNKFSFYFTYLPKNAIDEKFVSDLITSTFLGKYPREFNEEAARQIPDHVLSTSFISNCIDLIVTKLDKSRNVSDFILYPCYKGNKFCYDTWVPKQFLTNELLEKITLLDPQALGKFPKSLVNKVIKNKLFTEKLISKYARNKEILNMIKRHL
jgi:hypothetical protein